MQLTLNRYISNHVSTLGKFLIGGEFNCYVCEDAYHEKKIYSKTRIPRGRYAVKIKSLGSSRFDQSYGEKFGAMHKGMLELQGVPGYTGVLIHIGNTSLDTDGCLLVGMAVTVVAEMDVSFSVRDSRLAYEKVYPQIAETLLKGESVLIDVVDNDNPVDFIKETSNEQVA